MFHMRADQIHSFSENGYYLQRTNGRKLASDLHSHNFYEFLYIVSGSCVHERSGLEETLSAGSLVFLSPNVSHRFISQTKYADVIALSVVTEELEPLFQTYGFSSFSVPSSAFHLVAENSTQFLKLYQNAILDYADEQKIRIRMLVNQIFLFCLESSFLKTYLPPNVEDFLKKMENLELASEGIDAMLRLSGYSHSQLCRLTKKYLGMTPTEYINNIRMKHAYELIIYSTSSFEEICEIVGYESFSYFCKLVKKTFGCSVAKLRKETKAINKTV